MIKLSKTKELDGRLRFRVPHLLKPQMCSPILVGLSHIISGRFEDDRGEINLPTEIRIKIISSEPFHLLFNWAGSHWLNEWDQNGMETFSELGTLAYQSIIMIS